MIQFGTGGWRARIGEDFTCDNVRRVGGAVCAWLKENGRTDRPVIIGDDRRFLSCEAAKWLAEVFCAQGFQVLFLHRSAPTPLLMHTVLKQHLHCALQVTASHNPAIYNGIKLIVEEGRDAPVETTQRIEALANGTALDTRFVPFAVGEDNGMSKIPLTIFWMISWPASMVRPSVIAGCASCLTPCTARAPTR